MKCTNPAAYGVRSQDRIVCSCPAHLPDAVQRGGWVQPLKNHDEFTCEMERKVPFGFTSSQEDAPPAGRHRFEVAA